MTQGPNRLFDEFAKLLTDAAGAAQGLRQEAETVFRSEAERFLADMDLVKREDFDAVQEMASNARLENEALRSEIEALEKRVAALEKKSKPASRSSSRKSTSK